MGNVRKFKYREPRVTAGFEVDFVLDGKTTHGLCHDVSSAGIRAEFDDTVTVGNSGLLILRHPIGVLKVDAQVAYNEQQQVGLVFHFQSSWQEKLTVEFISSITNPDGSSTVI